MSAHPALRALCESMGLPAGMAAPDRPLVLEFERSGRLEIGEEADGGFAIALARPVSPHGDGVAAAALRAVHPDRGMPFAVKAAFHGDDRLVLLARLAPEEMQLPTLDRLIGLLVRLAEQAEAGEPAA